jgi:hypothetical protein
MLHGLYEGHELRAIIGDFRRLFFYTLAFGVSWRALDSPDKLKTIERIIYFAVTPVIIISSLRAWTGGSWTPEYAAEDLRAVSYASATVLFWVFYDVVSRLALMRSNNVLGQLSTYFWLLLVSFTFLIANYRLFWLIPLAGCVGFFVILWQSRMLRSMRLLRGLLFISIASLAAILLLKITRNQLYLLVEHKFVEDVLGFQFKNSFRYFVWGEAWSRFTNNPLLGVGIGDRLETYILDSQGNWYLRTSTTHNILIELLYQTGIAGFSLFLLPHFLFIFYIWRYLPKLPIKWSRPALVLLMTYFSMFLLGNFQPFLTVPSVAVLFYALMGITARYIYWGRRS